MASPHPDLVKERASSTIKPAELTPFFYGESGAKKVQAMGALIHQNPIFDLSDLYHLNRTERYVRACERALEFVRIVRRHSLIEDEEAVGLLEMLVGEDFFINLHLTMFIPALENLCSEEQKAYWLPLAKDFRILGTYAQTELAHGSNVAALQTTATLDMERDEWVLNTPTLEAAKWWPGGLGKSCTHCVLMARTIIKDKDYGIQAFILPIRNIETHESLPGVFLLDIGQKMGYNAMDNGGMSLHHVRVPRNYLLQKYVSVEKNGAFRKVGNDRMLYATMTYTRKQIITFAGVALAKGATIAVRYSAVRRQFPQLDQELPTDLAEIGKLQEAQILDYSTQQYALFPAIATAVGFLFAGKHTGELYTDMITAARRGDFSRLNELHVMTSALKGAMTMITIDQLEICRKAMGGHGYLMSSGIPLQLISYIPQATYEGDFVVLSIQAGRALLRKVQKKMMGTAEKESSDSPQRYVAEFDVFEDVGVVEEGDELPLDDLEKLLGMFRRRAAVMIYKSAQRMAEHLANGKPPLAALDEEKVAFTRIAKAHCHAVVLDSFKREMKAARSHPKAFRILRLLYLIYSLYWMEADWADFVAAGVAHINHQSVVMEKLKALMREFRPEAVSVVDAFGFSDVALNSVLGKSDGHVYEALLNATQKEPLNKSDVTEGYYRYIQFILHPERLRPSSSKL